MNSTRIHPTLWYRYVGNTFSLIVDKGTTKTPLKNQNKVSDVNIRLTTIFEVSVWYGSATLEVRKIKMTLEPSHNFVQQKKHVADSRCPEITQNPRSRKRSLPAYKKIYY